MLPSSILRATVGEEEEKTGQRLRSQASATGVASSALSEIQKAPKRPEEWPWEAEQEKAKRGLDGNSKASEG